MVAGPPRPLARSGRGRVLPPGLAQAPPQAARPRALDAHPALPRRRRARPPRPRLAARRDRGGVPPVGPHAPARADRRPRDRAHARRRPRAARALLPPARPPGAARARPRPAAGARVPAAAGGRHLPVGRDPRRLARPGALRGGARLACDPPPRAPLVRRRRPPRLDADHRSGAPPAADRQRAHRRRRPPLLDRPGALVRLRLRVRALLRRLRASSPSASSASPP